MFDKKIKLIGLLLNPDGNWHPEDYASCGARGCREQLSCSEIQEQEGDLSKEEYENRKEIIFKETSGRGHGAISDQSAYAFSIDNLTRASTLFLCSPQYAAHDQQSLRTTTAERGFYLPLSLKSTKAADLMERQFNLYLEMKGEKVPGEDARFILPLYTKTNICSLWNARELTHLHAMSTKLGVPVEVRHTVEEMFNLAKSYTPKLLKNRGTNYETLAWMPSSQLFSLKNQTIEDLIDKCDESKNVGFLGCSKIPMSLKSIEKAVMGRNEEELANLKHFHFSFLTSMSLSSFHQATRQRTWDQSVQSIYSAISRGKYVIPSSIQNTKFETSYKKLMEESLNFVQSTQGNKDVIGVIPHALQVYDLIHINGWNAVHSIGKRTCDKAQWEIRYIAKAMAKYIKKESPELGKYAVPQGITYGKCPEKEPCGKCPS